MAELGQIHAGMFYSVVKQRFVEGSTFLFRHIFRITQLQWLVFIQLLCRISDGLIVDLVKSI
jgi:hypothetical protein